MILWMQSKLWPVGLDSVLGSLDLHPIPHLNPNSRPIASCIDLAVVSMRSAVELDALDSPD